MTLENLKLKLDFPSYEEVAKRDPLGVDRAMQVLPNLNAEGNVGGLEIITREALGESQRQQDLSQIDALAIIRDMDFLTSSLLRHGVQPLDLIPELEEELLRISGIAKTVPRGTVFTYAAANPEKERRRSFTGTAEEDVFISAVARSIIALDDAVNEISTASVCNGLVTALNSSSVAVDEMVGSIIEVKKTVTPEFFSSQMRPYFESLTIGDKQYTGSGGAQIQLVAIDFMLWGCDEQDPDYVAFFEENVGYLAPVQQRAIESYLRANDEKGLINIITQNTEVGDESRQAAADLLRRIRKFRYPHRKIAQDNFELRPDDAVGSGSYKPDILDVLIDKTEKAIAQIEERHE